MNSFTQSWFRFKSRQLLSSSKIVQSSSLLKQVCSKLYLKKDFQGQTNSYFEMEFIIWNLIWGNKSEEENFFVLFCSTLKIDPTMKVWNDLKKKKRISVEEEICWKKLKQLNILHS